MFRSAVRALTLGTAALCATLAAQAASASVFTYDFKNAADQSAGAGNYFNVASTEDAAVKVSIWGGHLNYSGTGYSSVSGATAADWNGWGLGVLYGNDGSGGTHQIDNAGGGSDFVVLQFSTDVTLSSISRVAYGGNAVGTDTDVSYLAYSGSLASIANGLNAGSFNSLDSGYVKTGSSATSKIWIVAANVQGSTNDAFKLTSIITNTVTPSAVPEPASWAMMIAGFGSIGAAMRRRRKPGVVALG